MKSSVLSKVAKTSIKPMQEKYISNYHGQCKQIVGLAESSGATQGQKYCNLGRANPLAGLQSIVESEIHVLVSHGVPPILKAFETEALPNFKPKTVVKTESGAAQFLGEAALITGES